MPYLVKEIFATLQGEGANAGRAAVFCRFARCNLWSGHEEHRATAICRFCDTDFVGTEGPGGGRFATADDLAAAVAAAWPAATNGIGATNGTGAGNGSGRGPDGRASHRDHGHPTGNRMVVCTGGEPLLQLDAELVDALHGHGFDVAIETNGTLPAPAGIDWVCVSPKAGTDLVLTEGDELKVVFPQPGAEPERFEGLAFTHRFVQPMDGPDREGNTALAVAYCLAHPAWRLSVQTHKTIGIP